MARVSFVCFSTGVHALGHMLLCAVLTHKIRPCACAVIASERDK